VRASRLFLVLALGGLIVAVALGSRTRRPTEAPRADAAPAVRVLELPSSVDGQLELFRSDLGRVVVRSVGEQAGLRFHRHAHEAWLPVDGATATYSASGKLVDAALSAGELLSVPAYAWSAWKGAGAARLLGFIAAPEDEATRVSPDDERLADAADAVRSALVPSAWLLDKLSVVEVSGAQALGPYARDVVVYVADGRGEVRSGTVHAIGARQLVEVRAGAQAELVARTPLRVIVFDPARTTVSPILREDTKRYSQDDEELVIRDFFRDRRDGTFLDVGAAHYEHDSTTYYLERHLGWSGVAIDALGEYAEGYRLHRPRTVFVNALVTDKARGPQRFYRAEGFPEVSSVSRQLAEAQAREFSDSAAITEHVVPTSTLDAVLDERGVNALDFVSMDIEEHEPEALAGFDLARFHPELVCVEAHPTVRDALWRYFRRHGYVRQDQYLAWDSANWYFAPARGGASTK